MKIMKQLMSIIVFLITVWTRLHFSIAGTDISTVWSECGNIEYRNGSDFQRNLNQVLNSLVESVSAIGFNTSIAGDGKNSNGTVYGLLQCRGDLNSSDCEQCAATMQKLLLERCHNMTSGFIQLNECFLRYDNHNFYNDYNEGSDFLRICSGYLGEWKEKLADVVQDALSNIIEKAVQNPKLFATLEVETNYSDSMSVYSLAQCWRDLSRTNCQSCLDAGRSNISTVGGSNTSAAGCETGVIGARYQSRNCELRYELYNFFNTSIIPPPASGGKRSNVLGITLVVIAATLGLIAAIALWKWIIFPRECISRTRGAALRPSMSRVVSMLTSEQEHLPPPTRPAFLDLDRVGTPEQFKRPTVVDPDQTTSSSVATSSTIPNYDIYSGSADTTVILEQTRGENKALPLCPFIKRWRYLLSLLHYVRYYVYH